LHLDETDRTHLDLWAANEAEQLAEVECLEALGATRVEWNYPGRCGLRGSCRPRRQPVLRDRRQRLNWLSAVSCALLTLAALSVRFCTR